MTKLKLAGIAGSLRAGSYNKAALHAVDEIAPHDVELEIVTLEGLPAFNEDVEAQGWPDSVARLREKIAPKDGIIFATPEYNYSIPGVLKNAIDWLSRPERKSPLYKKPAAIIGATPSMIGTARAQAHLRQVAFYNAMPLLASVEILIFRAGEKFDENGHLTDKETRGFLDNMIKEFSAFVRTIKSAS